MTRTDGSTDSEGANRREVRERTVDPVGMRPVDWMSPIRDKPTALHLYLKDDKEWWLAHNPEKDYPGAYNGNWPWWTTYPSAGWELTFLTEGIARHHLEELYYVDYHGDDEHSIHEARVVPVEDAPEFIQTELEVEP